MSGPIPRPPNERFWYYVKKTKGCWIWTGSKDTKGYGFFCLDGRLKVRKYIKAHRFAYQLLCSEIPYGFDIHHVCKNTRCVNPQHLLALDRFTHAKLGKWANLTHCKRGHPYDEKNTYHNPSKTTAHRVCRECMRLHRRNYLLRKNA